MAQTYTKEKIDELIAGAEGTEVIANPTLAGTESALTGLQVGDTKYKIESGGGKLYAHRVWLRINNKTSSSKLTGNGFVSYIDRNPNGITTLSELLDALWNAGITQSYKTTPAFIVSLRETDVTSTQSYIKIFDTFLRLQMYTAQMGSYEIGWTTFDVSTNKLTYSTENANIENLYFTIIRDYISEL